MIPTPSCRTSTTRSLTFAFVAALAGALIGALCLSSSAARAVEPAEALELPATSTSAVEAGTHGPETVLPPARPTEVRVGVTVLALHRVSAPSEPYPRFETTLMLTARWSDPRVAFTATNEDDDRRVFVGAEAERMLDSIWSPDLVIENEDGERSIDARTLVVHDDGGVTYEEIFDAQLRTHFDLRAFPFDVQELPIVVESAAWNARNVVLQPIEGRLRVEPTTIGLDWHIEGLSHVVEEVPEVRSGRPFSQMTVNTTVRRVPGFYLGKVMLPLLLIVAFTWTTFWMTGEAAGTRMQRTFIALLSIVAFTQVIAGHLPRISYVTFLDAVMYSAFASTGLTLLQIILTHHAAEAGDKARVVRLDRIARVAFPVGFTAAVLASYVVCAF